MEGIRFKIPDRDLAHGLALPLNLPPECLSMLILWVYCIVQTNLPFAPSLHFCRNIIQSVSPWTRHPFCCWLQLNSCSATPLFSRPMVCTLLIKGCKRKENPHDQPAARSEMPLARVYWRNLKSSGDKIRISEFFLWMEEKLRS